MLRKKKSISVLLEIIVALICWNVLVTTSPNYMDVHYAKLTIGNLTLTYAMIRALLGYSIGLLIAESYVHFVVGLEKIVEQSKYSAFMTFLEAICFVMFLALYGNANYYRVNEFAFPILSAIMVFLICIEQGNVCEILKGKLFSYLGRYSFYFYLTHMVAREIIVSFIGERVRYLPLYLVMIVALSMLLDRCCKYITSKTGLNELMKLA